jgi:hypothetical protein
LKKAYLDAYVLGQKALNDSAKAYAAAVGYEPTILRTQEGGHDKKPGNAGGDVPRAGQSGRKEKPSAGTMYRDDPRSSRSLNACDETEPGCEAAQRG